MAEKKEYEMDEDYKEALENLLRLIEKRDRLLDFVNSRPFSPAERTKKFRLIDELTKEIEKFEQSLAKQYSITQKKLQLEEKFEQDHTELEEMTDKILPELLAHLKKTNPEAHDKFVANLKAIDEAEDDEDE